ncbi:hypothetical protein A3A21_03365 [Candidatus Jorgensenbacteria bacterium RIFCSPLOWO2_01_FULL_45_25b]|uniref:Uncharacterized protein n=1 Tax=Candidatus Jorgensenbacteria bacterium RIFCSPLOWO2_01_FULL_45_25b TaxID=1798471 RepID=A0A1F6BYQ6_9BACT|nr:MAG: hypothetical protein A3A21_03365 [Candidatus Jorgensenbacteria bacterium RIFCSPLOWO2_01_FULL_45_25b]
MVESWIQVVVDSLYNLWIGAMGVVGSIIGALVVFIIGLIVASGISAIVERAVKIIKLDDLLKKLGIEEHFGRAGIKINSARFCGKVVYWFFVLVFLLAVADVLSFSTLSSFLEQVLLYVPNVIVSILIMLAAFVVAHFLRNLVIASVKSARLHSPTLLGSITWWAVVIFGFLASLSQLGIAISIINALITGFIAMLALAGGIAFGLGGKDVAADILERAEKNFREK